MELTTKNIIKSLPFEEKFKEDLLARFDSLDPDLKLVVERALWDLYDAIYEITLQQNITLAMEKAGNNQDKLDPEFYKRVKEETEQELLSTSTTVATQVDLGETREQLEELLQQKQNSS